MRRRLEDACRFIPVLLSVGLLLAGAPARGESSWAEDPRLVQLEQLLADPALRPTAIAEADRLRRALEDEEQTGLLCGLDLVLGRYHERMLEESDAEAAVRLEAAAALRAFDRVLEEEGDSACDPEVFREAVRHRANVIEKTEGQEAALRWLVEERWKAWTSSPRKSLPFEEALAERMLAGQHPADPEVLAACVVGLRYHLAYLQGTGRGGTDEARRLEAVVRDLAGDRDVGALAREFQRGHDVPHPNPALEISIIVATWLFILGLFFGLRKIDRSVRRSSTSPPPDTSHDEEPVFVAFRHDAFTRAVLLDEGISSAVLAAMVFIAGFGLIAILNVIEGTFFPSAPIKLTFIGSIADPVNWAICVPAVVIASRRMIRYVPVAVRRFAIDFLPDVPNEEVRRVIAGVERVFQPTWISVAIVIAATVGSCLSFLDLAQRVDTYGRQAVTDPFLREVLAQIGWTKVPTVLGWYVMFGLSAVVSFLLLNVRYILFTIHLFRQLYRRFGSRVTINPFHADGCGGLSFAGEVALRMITVVSLGAWMGMDLVLRDVFVAGRPAQLYHYLILPIYVFVLPTVFLSPILDARRLLVSVKEEFLERLNRQSQKLLRSFRELDGMSEEEQTEALQGLVTQIEQLRLLMGQEIPIWPVNIRPIVGFVSAFVLPVLIPVLLQWLLLE